MALKLNEIQLILEVYESVPPESVAIIVDTIATSYVDRVVNFIVAQIDGSPHIEFHLKWITAILFRHGNLLQKRTPSIVSMLRAVQKSVGRKFEDLSKICHHNRYTLQYVLTLGGLHKKRSIEQVSSTNSADEEMLCEDSL